MSKALGAILPIAGALVGSIIPGVGTALGATLGGGLGGIAGSAIGGGGFGQDLLGGALGAGGGFLGLGGGIGQLASGLGGTLSNVGATLGTAGSSGAASVLGQAADPIEAISNAMTMTGTDTASAAAQALGFSNTNALLAAANPAWLTGPAALQGGLSNATGGVLGGGQNVGSFTGTAGATGGNSAINSLKAALGIGGGSGASGSGLGTLSSLLSIGSGAYGINNAIQMSELAKQIGQSGGQYAPQYAAQLSALEANPNSITSMPGYQAGLEAVERAGAAQGFQGSGNLAAALQQYGGNFFNQQVQQLQSLAQGGAGTSLQALQGQGLANNAASSALAALGYGAKGLGF
jgi:hypothetical protein